MAIRYATCLNPKCALRIRWRFGQPLPDRCPFCGVDSRVTEKKGGAQP